MDTILSTAAVRVLGCLVEKSIATPDYYPLSLNALVAACNQKSNRDPVVELDEKTVVRALDELREKNLAWSVTVTGSRVPKYKHRLTEALPLSAPAQAILCELMLRSPQTIGELRAHASRLADVGGAEQVQAVLDELAGRPEGALAVRLPRQPGRREDRYAHRLSGEPAAAAEAAQPPAEPARAAVAADDARLAELESQIASLRGEIEELKARLDEFIRQFK